MNVKALLKEYFGTEEFKRARKLARVRTAKVAEVKGKIAGFLRGDETLAAFADGVKAAVEEQAPLDPGGPPAPVWGFGGAGTSLFIAALLKAAPESKIEAELRRALAGIDTRDPSDRLRTFAAFVARAAKDANLGPETNLHVGYATCFLSFCWHALYDLEVPVFYGSSHRGVKALIAGGLLADPEYASRDLAERFRAFLRITRGLLELVRKVSPQLNLWIVESFLEWAAPRFEVASVGTASAMLQQVELGGVRGGTSSSIPIPQSTPMPAAAPMALAGAGGSGHTSGYYRALQMGATPAPAATAAAQAHGGSGAGSGSFRLPPPSPVVTIGGAAASGTATLEDTHAVPARGKSGAMVAPHAEALEDARVDTRRQKPKPSDESDERAKAVADVKAAIEDARKAEEQAAQEKARAEAEAKAQAEAKAKADAQAKEEAQAKAEADAKATEERARQEAEAQARAEKQAQAETQAKEAKAKADAQAKVDAQAKADAEAEAARAKAAAEAKAAEAKAAEEKAQAEAKAKADADAKTREESEARARKDAEAAKKEAEAAQPKKDEARTIPSPSVFALEPPPLAASPAGAAAEPTARRLSPFAPSATTRVSRAQQPPQQSKEEALAALGKETRFPERLLKDLDILLERRGQVALEGPTGSGKTLLARRFASIFAGSGQRIRVVQFHPSFKYEDFIEGPVHAGGGAQPAALGAAPAASATVGLLGGTHHAPASTSTAHGSNAGVLKQFSQRAARDPQNRYVMVLDDLGRGDAIAVLGEVFSLLEFREQEVVLPYSRESFSLPKNLYFIATACATQQSRGLGDPALRRRFPFMQVEPSPDALRGFLEEKRPEMAWVADVFAELNRRLVKEAGPRAQIGQSVFMQAALDEPEVERIFAYDVRPLIETCVDPKQLAKFELSALRKAAKA